MSADLSCTLTIVDPSILDVNNVFGHAEGLGHKVNCFTAKHAGWLPAPQFGDVLILRAVKVSSSNMLFTCDVILSKWNRLISVNWIGHQLPRKYFLSGVQGQIKMGYLQC